MMILIFVQYFMTGFKSIDVHKVLWDWSYELYFLNEKNEDKQTVWLHRILGPRGPEGHLIQTFFWPLCCFATWSLPQNIYAQNICSVYLVQKTETEWEYVLGVEPMVVFLTGFLGDFYCLFIVCQVLSSHQWLRNTQKSPDYFRLHAMCYAMSSHSKTLISFLSNQMFPILSNWLRSLVIWLLMLLLGSDLFPLHVGVSIGSGLECEGERRPRFCGSDLWVVLSHIILWFISIWINLI